MACCALFAALSVVVLLHHTELMMSETTAHTTVHVTGNSTVAIVTSEDVERILREKDAIIIDVRTFKEAAELGQIPSAHVLPGCTATLGCYLRCLSNKIAFESKAGPRVNACIWLRVFTSGYATKIAVTPFDPPCPKTQCCTQTSRLYV